MLLQKGGEVIGDYRCSDNITVQTTLAFATGPARYLSALNQHFIKEGKDALPTVFGSDFVVFRA